jgi:membrane protein required for colicin V production
MNPLDWLLAILLVYSFTRAAMRGIFAEAFALGGVILGFLFACWFYRAGATRLAGLITSPPIAQLAAFLLILVAIMVIASVIAKLLQRAAKAVGLGFFDRLLGGIFGLVRGAVLGVTLLLAVTAFLPAAPWVQNSLLAPYFLRAAHAVSFIMPSDLKLRLLDGIERIKHTTPDWIKPGPSVHTEHTPGTNA